MRTAAQISSPALVLVVLLVDRALVDAQVEDLAAYLNNSYEPEASRLCRSYSLASWEYNTNLTGEGNAEAVNNRSLEYSQFHKEQWQRHFQGVNWRNLTDQTLSRQLKFLTVLGVSALNESRLSELNNITTKMEGIYSRAKICPFSRQSCDLQTDGLSLDPDIEEVMTSSRDYEELQYMWKAWRDATGPKMRQDYVTYVNINNEAAALNGLEDYGAMWRAGYESDTFIADVDRLWAQVEPLYLQLHSYVLRRLRHTYGDKMDHDGMIPAHLLGNMWAQSWGNIYDLVQPYPNGTSVDVTSALREKGYTARRMFEVSDEFYQSLGLPSNAVSYDEARAMIVKPQDGREVVCHASAWDLCDRQDFRIKMCTNINMKDFVTIHHEMGHIQYYIQYKDQPITFRKGANPGFHEAVGDTIALSVSTPKHLARIGLLDGGYSDSEENDINSLMQMALDKVAFLPFGLLIDKWRWDVFSGNVTSQQWNSHWWRLRERYQKVRAPVPRSEQDFDPGAKYHIPADTQYIAYFVAHILQFQLHKALCVAAGEYDPADPASKPLHRCDIYQSTAAGHKLSAGLSLGGSKHWSEALEAMTGRRDVDGSALLEYFQPLHDYLRSDNASDSGDPSSGQSDETVPIVVGAVLAGLVLVVVAGYLVMRRRRALAGKRQGDDGADEDDDAAVEEMKPVAGDDAKDDVKVDAKVDAKAEDK